MHNDSDAFKELAVSMRENESNFSKVNTLTVELKVGRRLVQCLLTMHFRTWIIVENLRPLGDLNCWTMLLSSFN